MKRGFLLTSNKATSIHPTTKKPEGKVVIEQSTGKIVNDKSEHKDFKVERYHDADDDWSMTYIKVKNDFPDDDGFKVRVQDGKIITFK